MTKPSKQGKMLIEKSKVEHLRKMNAKQHEMLQDMQTKLHWMRSSLIEVFKQVDFYINPEGGGKPDVDGLRKFVIKCTAPPNGGDDREGGSAEDGGGAEGSEPRDGDDGGGAILSGDSEEYGGDRPNGLDGEESDIGGA